MFDLIRKCGNRPAFARKGFGAVKQFCVIICFAHHKGESAFD